MPFIAYIWLKLKLFDALILSISIPSEASILSKYSFFILFIIYIDIHLRKHVDNVCYFYEKTALTTYHARNFYRFI